MHSGSAISFSFACHGTRFRKGPCKSPDGRELCLVYNGDLWVVQYGGGKARRLTDTDATEWGTALVSGCQTIAFTSNVKGRIPISDPAAEVKQQQ